MTIMQRRITLSFRPLPPAHEAAPPLERAIAHVLCITKAEEREMELVLSQGKSKWKMLPCALRFENIQADLHDPLPFQSLT